MSAPNATAILENISWRLSNSNAELDDWDIAYDTWLDDVDGGVAGSEVAGSDSFNLHVSWHHLPSDERGETQFRVTVTQL